MLKDLTKMMVNSLGMKQSGGGNNGNALLMFLYLTLIALIVLFIKVFLVNWSYNLVVPQLTEDRMRRITMVEALLLVILVQSLFN